MDDKWPEAQLLDAVDDTCLVKQSIDEEYRALREGCHLAEARLDGAVADLRRDGEEELTALRHLRLDPHVALHERDESLGDGETQPGTAVLLQTRTHHVNYCE